jgi:hypothetical protein
MTDRDKAIERFGAALRAAMHRHGVLKPLGDGQWLVVDDDVEIIAACFDEAERETGVSLRKKVGRRADEKMRRSNRGGWTGAWR